MAVPSDLNDDLLLEIFGRLSLKYVGQCLTLSRSLRAAIAAPSFARRCAALQNPVIFHFSDVAPVIFSKVAIGAAPARSSGGQKCAILANRVRVLDSCNGVLLLHCRRRHYVFNPVTGGIKSVDESISTPLVRNQVGLVVDSGIKLVIIRRSADQLRFDVVVVSGGSAVLRYATNFACGGFNPARNRNIRPVYAYGSIHWLEHNAQRIVSFHVATEHSRIIAGPLYGSRSNPTGEMWFGAAQNKLHFLLSESNTITIFSHDYLRNQWQITYQIQNLRIPADHAYKNGKLLFFDGQRLYLLLREIGKDGQVFVHDLLSKDWAIIGEVGGWTDHCQIFLQFSPTLEGVSDEYLPNSSCSVTVKDCLRRLQRLLNRT